MSKIIYHLKQRLTKKRKNALILIVGDTGGGKSYAALKMAEAIDPTFHPGRIAHMRGSEFIRILTTEKLRRGNVVIWDDVGKGLKKRDWYDVVNKAIVDVLQVFRVLGLCVIFTCPDASFIDSNAISLFHYWGEMTTIDYTKKKSKMKFFKIQKNRRTGKTYWHYIRVAGKKITRLVTGLPSRELIRQYEKDKAPAVKNTIKRAGKTLDKIETKQKISEMTDGDIMNGILQNAEYYIKEYNKRRFIDPYAVMSGFKIGLPRANKIKSMVEKQLKLKG